MIISDTLCKFNDKKLPANFVSIATKIENNIPTHAAILIRYQDRNFLHHFPGSTKPEVIDDFNEDGWFVYKIIDALSSSEDEVGAILQYCYRICKSSKITYSYIADGSSYADKGNFISKIGLPEFGTCVGFCTNTLTNTIIDIEDSYLNLDDWDDSDLVGWVDKWSIQQAQKKYPDLDWTLYNAFKKRITPLEYLCSAFINEYPINKLKIDEIKNTVQESINNFFPSV